MRLPTFPGWLKPAGVLASLLTVALMPIAASASPFTISTNVDTAGTYSIAGSPIVLDASITSDSGDIVLDGPVTLGANVTLSAPNGHVTITGTLDGAHSLVIISQGSTFGGAVGSATALSNLTMSGGGATLINGGSVTTVGNQHYQELILGADTTLQSSPPGLISYSSLSNQTYALTVHGGPAPTVTSVSGCINSGVSTTRCPLGGGNTITVVGSGFTNAFLPTVNVGTNVGVIDDAHLSFTLAPGQPDQLVTVLVTTFGGTSAGTAASVRYAPAQPTVTSVSGCMDAGSSTQNCPILGGLQLNIKGTGFSQGSPTVNVCANAVVSTDTAMTCTLDPGAPGSSTQLVVTTDGGPSAASGVTVAYVASDGGSGGLGGDGGGVNPSATPELDSLLLFGFGASGLAGYALTRLRARKSR